MKAQVMVRLLYAKKHQCLPEARGRGMEQILSAGPEENLTDTLILDI